MDNIKICWTRTCSERQLKRFQTSFNPSSQIKHHRRPDCFPHFQRLHGSQPFHCCTIIHTVTRQTHRRFFNDFLFFPRQFFSKICSNIGKISFNWCSKTDDLISRKKKLFLPLFWNADSIFSTPGKILLPVRILSELDLENTNLLFSDVGIGWNWFF